MCACGANSRRFEPWSPWELRLLTFFIIIYYYSATPTMLSLGQLCNTNNAVTGATLQHQQCCHWRNSATPTMLSLAQLCNTNDAVTGVTLQHPTILPRGKTSAPPAMLSLGRGNSATPTLTRLPLSELTDVWTIASPCGVLTFSIFLSFPGLSGGDETHQQHGQRYRRQRLRLHLHGHGGPR